ncbi:hypothetical protein JCM16303_003456 [Sporobolomyces ruberrimus]
MIATDDLRDQLVQLLASLPADANPYLALSGQLRSLVLPADDPHARNQLYVLSGVFALTALLSFLSLFIRWRKVPGLVFLILLQPTMAFERQLFEGEGRRDFMYWLALPWLALAYSGVIATWAILSSHVAQLQARGKWTSSRWSLLVNSFGFVFFLIYTLLLVPPAVIVGRLYELLIGDLDNVTTILSGLSKDWTNGPPNLSTATLALHTLGEAAIDYFQQLQILFCVFAVASLLLAILMSVAAIFYLSLLRKEINSIGRPLGSEHGLILQPTASHRKLRRIWQTIFFTVGVNIIIAILLAVNSLVIAVAPEKLAQRNHLRVALLLPLFSVGAFGLLSASMLFLRAIEAAPSDDRLLRAARDVVERGESGRSGKGKTPPESQEATMVGSIQSLKKPVLKKDTDRRSSWLGRKSSLKPQRGMVLVDVQVEVDSETTTCSDSRKLY